MGKADRSAGGHGPAAGPSVRRPPQAKRSRRTVARACRPVTSCPPVPRQPALPLLPLLLPMSTPPPPPPPSPADVANARPARHSAEAPPRGPSFARTEPFISGVLGR